LPEPTVSSPERAFASSSHPLPIFKADLFPPLFLLSSGNVIPKTIVKLYQLSRKALESGNPKDMEEALKLQDIVSQADWIIVKSVRLPLPPASITLLFKS
jgi:hypothetical protein